MSLLVAVDGARHQFAIKGDADAISFNAACVNRRLLKLGHTSTQSTSMLTFKKILSDEKSWVSISAAISIS